MIQLQENEAEFYKARTLELCDIAVQGMAGRRREDPVIQAITEGHGGSSCGFLLHWIAMMLGIRERWVNRDDVTGYRDQQNLSLLFGALWNAPGPKCARLAKRGELFKASDFLLMEDPALPNDDHVCVCALDFDGNVLQSYDMGQKGAAVVIQSHSVLSDARFCERAMKLEANGRWETRPENEAGKQVKAVISIPQLIAEARANGKLVDPIDPREWRSRVAAGL